MKALPESLGQCKLLEDLCVRAAAPPAVRAFAAFLRESSGAGVLSGAEASGRGGGCARAYAVVR